MKRYKNFIFFVSLDILISVLAVVCSILLDGKINMLKTDIIWYVLAGIPIITVLFSHILNCYRILWRFARIQDFLRVAIASFFTVACFAVVCEAINQKLFKMNMYIMLLFVNTFLHCIARLIVREVEEKQHKHNDDLISGNIMVIGAGSAGSSIIADINVKNHSKSRSVKCVIDDDKSKHGQYINGALIVGDTSQIPSAVKKYNISMIVFAIPSCTSDRKASIMRICQQTGCELRTIPSIFQMLVEDNVTVSSIRKVEIEDLLGRDPININVDVVMDYVENRVVMVTGGGGSIGSELCRQIAAHNPQQLIIFDVYENNAYDIQNELKHTYPDLNLVTLIGSVRDSKRLDCVFKKYSPDIVYHAAAHKHVPLMEDSPNETLKNNVFGTYKTAQCAGENGVKKFILISTDKAVNPTNIMGASKRICEMIVQSFNSRYDTEFVAVRFGNVLGSNGSVIPLFKKQIAEGGPVTVTDPNIIRYFMTIPEAVSLVLQAGSSAKGGEIFVLDMGEPVRILDLAENLIRLSGFKPYEDIKIEFTGLRPGEKLYEELLMSEEGLKRTQNQLIYIGKPIRVDQKELEDTLEEMKQIMYDDDADVRALVKRIVPSYKYSAEEDTVIA